MESVISAPSTCRVDDALSGLVEKVLFIVVFVNAECRNSGLDLACLSAVRPQPDVPYSAESAKITVEYILGPPTALRQHEGHTRATTERRGWF